MTSPDLHRFGRAALIAAWPLETGAEATLPELQIAGAVGNFESAYGTGTFRNRHVSTDENGITTFDTPGDAIRNTNNWGAVQCKGLPPCDAGCFEATDSDPRKITETNPQGLYQACFKAPASPAEGARIFVHQITKMRPNSWAAMKAGDIDAFSLHMYLEHYYGGFGATQAERVNGHATAVDKGVREIAAALGEPVVATRGGPGAGGMGGGWGTTFGEVALLAGGMFGAGMLLRKLLERRGLVR